MDAGGVDDAQVALARYFAHLSPDGGPAGDDDGSDTDAAPGGTGIDRALVDELVSGVAAHRAEIDDLLTELSRNWRLERMAVVERNVIRIALFELRHVDSVPVSVVLNEAVELAKRYGTAEGAAFVNGLLDRAATEMKISR
jgi:transcription antitermination protein NusB